MICENSKRETIKNHILLFFLIVNNFELVDYCWLIVNC
jgi:hypothetical protein